MKTNIPIMINGKLKGAIPVNKNETKKVVMKKAMNMKVVNDIINGSEITETIYVPNRMFNIVVK